jgi:hypothetical protein
MGETQSPTNPFVDPTSTQEDRDRYLAGLSPEERGMYESGEPGDTGWVDVGSSRVKEVRFVPSGPGMFDVGNLYVRFNKYDTAYVYRGVGRPIANNVNEMGMAGSGIGSYINSVLNGFSRDYCTDEELNKYFGGYGGTYRGP